MGETVGARLAGQLQNACSVDDVHAAYASALAAFDRLSEQALAATGAHLDCCAGCSYCCWLRVDVFAHEVFLIARHIRTHFSEAEQKELRDRLEAHAAAVLPLTPFEHATRNQACPLLREGRCSVYAVRPMACRRQHSTDVKACERTFAEPTNLELPGAQDRAVFRKLTEAIGESSQVYAALALDTTVYELGTALQEALEVESSEADWLGHMEAFARASITPTA